MLVISEIKYPFGYVNSRYKVIRKEDIYFPDGYLELLSVFSEGKEIFIANIISNKYPYFGYFYENSSETHAKGIFDVLKTLSFDGFSKSGLLKEFTSYSLIKGCNPWFLSNNKFIH